MVSTTTFTLLALSALGRVVSAAAPAQCTAIDPAPEGVVCGASGFVQNPAGKLFAVERLSLEGCSNYCGSNDACNTFQYRNTNEGSCVLYGDVLSDMRFSNDDFSWDNFYEKSCFECSKNTLIDLDFNVDQSTEDWSMTQDVEDSFFFDNLNVGGRNVFRVLDAADSGSATITYTPTFQLEAGPTYRLQFMLRTNLPDKTDFSLLTFYLATNEEIVFEYTPSGGTQVGEATLFSTDFTLEQRDAGEGTFLFNAKSSGLPLDWYFNYLYIQRI
ncbi:hypothetical protein G7Z17_g1533 [Cylindrodendrum hubeiense]|uniref:Apple domain-containing protein n=1 Tax=Cylindrodendrum hubeiense TaxID=595255 RepID=A0A9P5LK05_9HYPO|nr:hypothetical protein G7Z17_g1533 [Cylindrodendrum hubeiense]